MRYAAPRKYGYPSRYGIYRQIVDDKDTYTETVNKTIIAEKDSDIYHEVQMHEENRLDIIANKYYGSPDLWWVIAMGNNIIDPFIVKVGDIIRIPNLTSLTKWKGALYGRV
jgi:hypothetical protein